MQELSLFKNGRNIAYSSNCFSALSAIDCHKEQINDRMALAASITGGESGQRLDLESWLPAAAPHYQISTNIRDFVIIPVPAIISDIPNTNGVAMPRNELLAFNTEAGRLCFKTWKGKPTFREHENQDISKAKGVILDCFASPLKGYGNKHIKVMMLAAYDRTKDPELCNQILSGEENAYSMGAFFDSYACSVCGADKGGCRHTDPRSPLKLDPRTGTLAYRSISGITGFELSSVSGPAYICAVSDYLLGAN